MSDTKCLWTTCPKTRVAGLVYCEEHRVTIASAFGFDKDGNWTRSSSESQPNE